MSFTNLAYITNATLADNVTMNNTCIILTLDNVVEILDNIQTTNYVANQPLISTPEEVSPDQDLCFNVVVYDGEYKTDKLFIGSNGKYYLANSYSSVVVYTNGFIFNIANKFYNAENGTNTYMSGDLSEDV